jgi:uncharacterized heparinase superfamily protein
MANLPSVPDLARQPHSARDSGALRLGVGERLGLAMLAARRARRHAIARVRRSRLLRWQHRNANGEDLLIAPRELRAADPSFPEEVAAGNFGLGGAVVELNGRSPFSVRAPSAHWARELHGFSWLRNFEPLNAGEIAMARDLVQQWLTGASRRDHLAWAPDVVARRVLSWLSHAGPLLDGADRGTYGLLVGRLADQLAYLSASWRDAPDGYPRLLALLALTQGELCVAGYDQQLVRSERHLLDELARQFPAEGGHLSRNPEVLIELLLDLLPLRQCFVARGKKPDEALLTAISRMTAMLRHMRLGDGTLAHFNGTGATELDSLATVLGYDDGTGAPSPASRAGYVRLQRGATVVIVDAGTPPPIELAGMACAGCLSFEMSTGADILLTNGGAPGRAVRAAQTTWRATATHNTLALNEQSSSRLLRDARLDGQIGAAPIRHPDRVSCDVREINGAIALEASHNGYLSRFGLVHRRTLTLDASGERLEGIDVLTAAKGVLRFSRDIPFAVHFHLHPGWEVRLSPTGEMAELYSPAGLWQFAATGAVLSIEESTHFAGLAGPQPAHQVVLRGVCYGAAEVKWVLQRAGEAEAAAYDRTPATQSLTERLAEASAGFADDGTVEDGEDA